MMKRRKLANYFTVRPWRAYTGLLLKRNAPALAWFKRHRDQTYIFVDCLSFVVMEKLRMCEALAVDSDFTHRFIAYPGPKRG